MAQSEHSRRADILFALAAGLGIYILWILRHTVLLIYMSVLFAVILAPFVRAIQRMRVGKWQPSRGAAVLLLFAAIVIVAGLVIFVILPPILQEAHSFGQALPGDLEALLQKAKRIPFGRRLAEINPASLMEHVGNISARIVTTFRSLASGVFDIVTLGVLTAYFILDGPQSFEWAMSLIPGTRRPQIRLAAINAANRAQKWLSGQLLMMLILGVCTVAGLGAMRVQYFYAIAVFAGLANFVPVVGAVATLALASIVAALDSWLKLLGVWVFFLVYLQVENAYIYPRVMKSNVGLSGVAVLAALAVGGSLAGILGSLVAVPTAAMIATVIREYLKPGRPRLAA